MKFFAEVHGSQESLNLSSILNFMLHQRKDFHSVVNFSLDNFELNILKLCKLSAIFNIRLRSVAIYNTLAWVRLDEGSSLFAYEKGGEQ